MPSVSLSAGSVKVALYVVAYLAHGALAQDPPLSFDAATVKPSKSTGGINNQRDPVQATWANTPLAIVMTNAYRIQRYQLLGGPNWIDADHWDIVGKSDHPATRDQQNRMFQSLLVEFFKLKVHGETKPVVQYELVVAKNGPKVRESLEGSSPGGTTVGRGLIAAHGISAAEFVGFLKGELGRPVIDRTGLTKKYDFKLEWIPDESQPNSGGEAPFTDSPGPTIFAAIQDLGFQLKPIKGQMDVLIIDHVEKPSESNR